MGVLFSILLILLLLFSLGLTILSLPGNWLMVLVLGFYVWLMPSDSWADLHLWVLFVVLGLALLGELLEFLAGMLGVARVKGTTRSAAFALIGTLVGSVVGLVVSIFIPIPVIAQLVLAILFSSFGAMIGAILGEWKEGVSRERLSEVGRAAFVGRVLGTVSKVVVGGVMVVFVMMVLTIQGIQALL